MRAVIGFVLLMAVGLGWMGAARAEEPEVIIDPGGVPPAALSSITEAVAAITRLAEDQDGGEIDRLRRRARDAVLAALATQGYFTPKVTLQAGEALGRETWDISIEPGKRATVSAVDLKFTGRVTRPEYAERVAELRESWSLKVGQPFINSDWNKAKSTLLDDLSSRDFMLAYLAESDAAVYAETAEVRLSVTFDSGPLVRMGPMHTQGFKRVPESLAKRYVRYDVDEPYDQNKLNEWQQMLQSTSFFRGAFVTLGSQEQDEKTDAEEAPISETGKLPAVTPAGDPEVASADASSAADGRNSDGVITLPVDVRVVEGPARRVSASIGLDDEVGARAQAVYQQNVVFDWPVIFESGISLDRKEQRAYADFHLPPDEKGQKDSFGFLARHKYIQGQDERRVAVGATRVRERKGAGDSRVDYENRWGALLAYDQVKLDGGDAFDLPTATLTSEFLRRDVNDKYDPREGNLISLGGGVGMVLNTGKPFFRTRIRAQQWWPVGERDVLTVRGEVGRIWSDKNTRVPDDFGFRTGGARSIRGYRYLSIGEHRDDAVVGAATLAVASIEYDHYFDERWGMGVFVDAGDAAESFGEMKLHLGYGAGLRVRTPAGPIFLDVAYGQERHDLRLHFSLGIAF
ncbi:BamA/TamA family outer membrane protein [Bordetella sp. 02P26C-1]|uniref:autotransporter assembly complex protein TamA n=1 Tax=Bordetella sp. 02P26C-1 TaxID=2683195 RepID=UPI0013561FE2|nr:BamA/TamA family outer membrane protein [Bordetella sp. 02P26C-1]